MASTDTDIVIAVMGMTGVGKSSFIRRMTGDKDIFVGHTLSSATEQVTSYKFCYAGKTFTLVDTPGFDDSRHTDEEIVRLLLQWLRQSMNRGIRLNGIIYLHRITEPRMRGTALSNMNMFRRLCGPDCFANVVLGTTFWSEVDLTVGASRERELWDKDEYWGSLIKEGATIARIGQGDSADRRLLLKMAQNSQITLQAQEEMQSGRTNAETSAAKVIGPDQDVEKMRRTLAAKLETEERNAKDEQLKHAKRQQMKLEKQKYALREEERKQQEAYEQDVAMQAALQEQQDKIHLAEERRLAKLDTELQQIRKAYNAEADRKEAAERHKKYNSHKCTQTLKNRTVVCNKCKQTIIGKHKRSKFYHCCHCKRDNFDLCRSCGPLCLDKDHPPMKLCGIS